jgi:hypothetical protein
VETKKLVQKLAARFDAEAPSVGTQIKKAIEVIKQARKGANKPA